MISEFEHSPRGDRLHLRFDWNEKVLYCGDTVRVFLEKRAIVGFPVLLEIVLKL